jgi:predicted nuclease of predicted toxin-antitoxin system
MISFLADENISPQSADHLEGLGYPCRSLRRDGPPGLTDSEIVALAKTEGHVIVTHDLDFGEIYYLTEKGKVGILVLRLRYQTVEAVNAVLERFLQTVVLDEEVLCRSLVVISEARYRVYQGPRGEF